MREILSLSDQALLEKTRVLVREERELTARILHHLREVERRRLFVDLGYPSLFEYAVHDLHYSEASAQRRISAMRLLKELPELESKIEEGSLSLSVLSQAQRFFRQEAKLEKPVETHEKREILASLEGKSSREAEKELLSRSSEPLALRPESVRPMTETHSELRFLATKETLEQLERIKGLLGHTHPELSLGELVALMAKMTLEKLDPARTRRTEASHTSESKKREAHGEKARASQLVSTQKPSEQSRYVQAALKREIWRKAQGKCERCGSFHRLQIDHITPLAKGGLTTAQNLRLLCFHCNQRQADLKLGLRRMEIARGRRVPIATSRSGAAGDRGALAPEGPRSPLPRELPGI